MIKKLRRNFITTAMISVFVVLVIIVAAMNIANYVNSDSEADVLLSLLADNGGSFERSPVSESQPPAKPEGEDIPPEKPDSAPAEDNSRSEPTEKTDGSDNTAPPGYPENYNAQFDPRRRMGDRGLITAETPYETRFFTVVLKDSGDPVTIDTGKIAAVTADEALSMAQELLSGSRDSGYRDTYKYLIRRSKDNNLCIFIDRTRALRSVTNFMWISLLVALGALAAIFVLLLIFSGMVIKPVAESYEKQKKFITNAGHELKTPLAVINSCTEVIEMEQGESKWTKGITSQTERLATLTKELVTLARMDEGGEQLNTEEFLLSETVSEILDPFSIMAEQKGIAFTADIQPDIMYKGDKSLLAKLCSILADNAVKYTPEDGSVTFTLIRRGKRITLVSENTAEEMERGAHPEFFDRFRRGDSSHNSDKPGYGIGLSMAQSVVTAHGGRIDAFSKDGKSLTITVRL
ncbi:MAG: HAMP domain-containing histidine kinase [Ruminiclostridium sp.]|nr:HAMP domain-containing histidine kinase [Ruminiclostridium sp.]